MSNKKKLDSVIGIDFGERNMGLALGKGGLVAPLRIISNKSLDLMIHELIRTGIENKIDGYVIGLPLTNDGKDTSKSLEIKKFSKLLRVRSKKPVEFQNEYGTTQDSVREALNMGIRQKGRGLTDHIAAAITLKSYYE